MQTMTPSAPPCAWRMGDSGPASFPWTSYRRLGPPEVPADAAMVLDTTELTPEAAAQAILSHLEREGHIGVNDEPLG